MISLRRKPPHNRETKSGDPKIFLLFHVHSNRSHDSKVSVSQYVEYLEKNLDQNEWAVLGISDHNVLPLAINEAMRLSTAKVLVIPGIQWKLRKSIVDAAKLVTRRDVLTFGNHDDLPGYIRELGYRVLKSGEIFQQLTEEQFLNYVREKEEMILTIPHPRHFIFDYYGKKQIKRLKEKVDAHPVRMPFFVEDKTGYDPFPRVFSHYKGKYLTLAGPDAHQILSALRTKSLFSVEAYISCHENKEVLSLWAKMVRDKRDASYQETMRAVFRLLVDKNEVIRVRKHYLRTDLQFLHSIPAWTKRRVSHFPHNLLK